MLQHGKISKTLCLVTCMLSHVWLSVTLWIIAHPQPPRLFCSWDSLGKNIGVGCHVLLERIFLTQGSNPVLPHCRQILVWATKEAHLELKDMKLTAAISQDSLRSSLTHWTFTRPLAYHQVYVIPPILVWVILCLSPVCELVLTLITKTWSQDLSQCLWLIYPVSGFNDTCSLKPSSS